MYGEEFDERSSPMIHDTNFAIAHSNTHRLFEEWSLSSDSGLHQYVLFPQQTVTKNYEA